MSYVLDLIELDAYMYIIPWFYLSGSKYSYIIHLSLGILIETEARQSGQLLLRIKAIAYIR